MKFGGGTLFFSSIYWGVHTKRLKDKELITPQINRIKKKSVHGINPISL